MILSEYEIDPLVLAYLAGIIDADGYITIQRSVHKERLYFGPKVGIAGTRREPHDLASSLWGGNVGCYHPKIAGHLPQFQWSRNGASAVKVIEAVRPFLRIKGEQADLAIDLWEHLEFGRGDNPYPWFGPGYDATSHSHFLCEEMIGLNQSRSRLRKRHVLIPEAA
jgi:hypothetical protein